MKLKKYFDKHCVNIAQFARNLEVHPATIHRILDGHEPKLGISLKIEKFTEREVTCEDLMDGLNKS